MDNPRHQVFRELIAKRFTPRYLKSVGHDVEVIGKEIVDKLLEKSEGGEGECDFVEEVSAPLPIAVIGWLLGVPKEDWPMLFDWTNAIIGAGDPEFAEGDMSAAEQGRAKIVELFTYFAKLIEEKAKKPDDALVSLFNEMRVDGKPLELMDKLAWCLIITVAGNETTRNATSGGMLGLVENQDELRRCQKDMKLLPGTIEEMIRWSTPIIHFAREATCDYELRGKTIKKGDPLALFYPSANRDEEVFEDPFAFRIDRDPNRHLSFGIGEHFCVGSHLARLEMIVAYRHLIPRLEEVELSGPPERLWSSLVGGVKHLPIRYKVSVA
jgi:cytochrome P450